MFSWPKPPKPLVDRMIGVLRRQEGYHCYPNLWCDLICQVQSGEYILTWAYYVDLIQGLIREELLKLSEHHQERLWLKSEPGWDYRWECRWYEKHRHEDPDLQPPERTTDQTEDLVHWFWAAACSRAADADLEATVYRGRPVN